MTFTKCYDKRECFAKDGDKCLILTKGYDDGECPFQKKCYFDVVVDKKIKRKLKGKCIDCPVLLRCKG